MDKKLRYIIFSVVLFIVIFIAVFYFLAYGKNKISNTNYPDNNIKYVELDRGCGNLYQNGKLIKLKPENVPIKVLYEDKNMLVVYKPAGMLTIPTPYKRQGSLVNALLYKYNNKLSNQDGELCRGIVHRLDRDTSGLLMVAKNNKTHAYLKKQIRIHNMKKKYYAIVKGVIEKDSLVINKKIKKSFWSKYKMVTSPISGKDGITIVKVLERYKDATLVEVCIITGRTHQIRVHMASIGHPVLNDNLYGKDEKIEGVKGQVLMSYQLTFPKPYSGKKITVTIPKDEEFLKVISMLKNNSK